MDREWYYLWKLTDLIVVYILFGTQPPWDPWLEVCWQISSQCLLLTWIGRGHIEQTSICSDCHHALQVNKEHHYTVIEPSGPWFNIKMPSYQYRKSHCGDKTIVRSSYLHNGISYAGKTTSLYGIESLPWFLKNTHNRHPIAGLLGPVMGCLLWHLVSLSLLVLNWYTQYNNTFAFSVTLDNSGSPIDFQWGSQKYPG